MEGSTACAKPPPYWRPETLDSTVGTIALKLQNSSYVLANGFGCQTDLIDQCAWVIPPRTQGDLAFSVGDLLMVRTTQSSEYILVVLGKDLKIVSNGVSDKPSKDLGRTLVNTASGFSF